MKKRRSSDKRLRVFAESLERRRLLAAVSWISSGSGDFDNPANWSNSAVPTASDDVTINVPGITVTHSTGTDSVHSLVCDDAFSLSGGSLSVATNVQVNNTFDIGDAPGTTSGALVMDSGSAANGTITGTGSIVFGGGGGNSLVNGSTSNLDIDVPVSGNSGTILNQNSSGFIVNQSVIDANQSTSLILFSNVGTLTNDGTFEAENGGTLTIQTPWAGQGTLVANNGGAIAIDGQYIAAPGGNTNIGIGSNGAGAISVTGAATLNGNLNIGLLSGFTPTVGTVYTIGSFGSVTGNYTYNGLATGDFTFTPSLAGNVLSLTVGGAKVIGGLDPNFGSNGLASHDVGITSVSGVVLQPNGQTVICGTAGSSPNQALALTRYNLDGSLDTNFGSDGVVTTSLGSGNDQAGDVHLLANGDVLVAGTVTTSSGSEFALAEYTSAGALDTTFGNGNGFVLASFSTTPGILTDDTAKAMAVASNGTIYIGGSSDAAGKGLDFAIAAFNANGSPDTSFGSAGLTLLDFSGGDDVIEALAIQSNGDVVAAGSSTDPSSGVVSVALARFLPTGALDTHFGSKGKLTTSVRGVADVATSVAVDSKGKIVIGGLSATGSSADGSLSADFLLIRYTSTGAIDKTFGGGPVITSFGQPAAVSQIDIEANGDILASGKTVASLNGLDTTQLGIALARYTPNGKLDTSFNMTGTAIITLSDAGSSPGFAAADLSFNVPLSLSPQDTASTLLSEFQAFEQSSQGVIAVTSGGELLDVGNSGSNTVEAAIVTSGIELAAALIAKLPASALEGAKESLTVKITESGTDPAVGAVTVQLIASPGGLNDLGVPPFDIVPEHVSLKQGKTQSFVIHYALPHSAGTFNIVANVSSGSFTELNGANNAAASPTQVILAAPFIDLAGSDLSSGTITPGKSDTIQFTVANDGNIAAKSTPVEILASVDGLASDGTELAMLNLPLALNPNATRHYRLSFKVPTTLPANRYELVAVLDPNNTLHDPNLANNVVVDSQAFTVS